MGEGPLAPVLMVYDVKAKDRFLLCSDGLSSAIDEKEIKAGMKIKDRENAVTYLIDAAYAAGAPDNVTVLLADVDPSAQSSTLTFMGSAS
jgi:serine/threonine protein phosphatase PrpC